MINEQIYSCGICKTIPTQLLNHKLHINSQKHKNMYELFKLNLSKLNNLELEQYYKTTNINSLLNHIETIIYIY